eukprot:TRINITY_DN6582_c0_g1_i2.p1 TRINITY_DN6582_c0_g1~~TRINITY_DN6582_c0_g1_i2.p1  ORF type:complete len:274 (-),score=44.52 TRINITY_DN6582_c0_g1_i2:47-814(-)
MTITREEGVTSLWRGLTPTLVMALPNISIYFTAYDTIKFHLVEQLEPGMELYIPLVAGAVARCFSTTVTAPLELMRTYVQAQVPSNSPTGGQQTRTMMSFMRASFRAGGFSNLFVGLGPSLIRDVPFSALYWFIYESMRAYINTTDVGVRATGTINGNFTIPFLCGATSGTVAAIATTPIDVVKTRAQAFLNLSEGPPMLNQPPPMSSMKMLQTIWRQEGMAGLTMGMGPRVAKVAPACAIMIGSFEMVKSVLRE